MSFSVISTFSGCGGSSLGYQMAGGKVHLAVEWDNHAVECYQLNFPDTPIFHGDIAKLSVEKCLGLSGIKQGELDIFDGSPPCQGFSTAGKRKTNDDRNQLFREYCRLLEGLKPKVFVMENVSGMVKGKMKLIFAEILKNLKACGYQVKARLLNAMYFNVSQSRARLIFIGVRNDLEVEPSHPKPLSRPIPVKDILPEKSDGLLLPEKYQKVWLNTLPGSDFGFGNKKLFQKRMCYSAKKLHPNKPSFSVCKQLRIGLSGIHRWDEPKLLSILELKKISSFPDDFKLTGSYSEQWARIGNSVPPLFMKAIVEHIRDNILSKIQ